MVALDCLHWRPLEQGIRVIAVEENKNLMNNDLDQLPWATGQFHRVPTYLEAAGVMLALRAGLSIKSVKRPLESTKISTHGTSSHKAVSQGHGAEHVVRRERADRT